MWNYSGDPAASRKDEVRFLIGDTNSDVDEQMLQDEEILYVLSLHPVQSDISRADGSIVIDRKSQPLMAALVCAEAVWMYFSRQADERLPPVNFEYAARAKNYKAVVDDLRRKVALRGGAIVYAGGISIGDKNDARYDEDRLKPFFYRQETDNKGAINSDQENLLGLL